MEQKSENKRNKFFLHCLIVQVFYERFLTVRLHFQPNMYEYHLEGIRHGRTCVGRKWGAEFGRMANNGPTPLTRHSNNNDCHLPQYK